MIQKDINQLKEKILLLKNNKEIKDRIENQLYSFSEMSKKDDTCWFSELCFCILTANSKALTALEIQNIMNKMSPNGFSCLTQEKVSEIIRNNKHRFHNNKSKFIVEARKYSNIKELIFKEIENKKDPREFLVNNIKGIAYKESSHFLRNVGFKNYAILDRHVLALMEEYGLISNKPKSINKKNYLEIEEKLLALCKKTKMTQSELDMYLFYIRSGQILK